MLHLGVALVNSRYQEKLQKQFLKSVLTPAVACFGIFAVVLFVYTIGYNLYSLYKWSQQAETTAQGIYRYFYRYLTDPQAQDTMMEFISGTISDRRMTSAYRSGCSDEPVKSELLLMDKTGEAVYYSGLEEDYNTHLAYYQQILYEKRTSGPVCVNKVYYMGGYAKWILDVLLRDGQGELVGQAFLMLDESALIPAFHKLSHEVILTNDRNLAIMSTNQALLTTRHFFLSYDGSSRFSSGGTRYLVKRVRLEDTGGYVYTLIELQNWSGYYLFGCAVLLAMALLTMAQSRRFAEQLANDSAKSLEKLHAELLLVQENPDHQISIDTDDEFGEIAQRINHLLCVIKELNEKSLALERSRNDMEKAQIKSRLHPHFLYNTLESIHFSILLQKSDEASEMLLKLTELLRYSIDNTSSRLTLEEDMDHIKEYLDIMRFRHGDTFTYRFDIAEDTKGFLIPPLFIQPLVENSLKYGFLERGSLSVRVKTWQYGGYVYIRVSDNGTGLKPQQLEQLRRLLTEKQERGHFGLSLVADSVKLQYGPESTLTLDSVYGSGFTVELKLKRKVTDDGI